MTYEIKCLCDDCLHSDADWFDKGGRIVKTLYCVAARPQFPKAHTCVQYEPKEAGDAE